MSIHTPALCIGRRRKKDRLPALVWASACLSLCLCFYLQLSTLNTAPDTMQFIQIYRATMHLELRPIDPGDQTSEVQYVQCACKGRSVWAGYSKRSTQANTGSLTVRREGKEKNLQNQQQQLDGCVFLSRVRGVFSSPGSEGGCISTDSWNSRRASRGVMHSSTGPYTWEGCTLFCHTIHKALFQLHTETGCCCWLFF